MRNINKKFCCPKRPRDASYLSVVSFNRTKHRVESFIVSYVGYRLRAVKCAVTLRHLIINISSSSPAINTAAYYQRCVRDGGRRPPATLLTIPACCSANSRH